MNVQNENEQAITMPLARSPLLLNRQTSGLLVVDVQEKLVPLIASHQRVIWNIRRLLDTAKIFEIQVAATEQYPKGLGHTVEPIKQKLNDYSEKLMFSCRECVQLFTGWRQQNIWQLVVVGIETHVCVQQTVLDLLAAGFEVSVAVDAVGSRWDLDNQYALRRMEQSGATLTTTESLMFEWCECSGTGEFKKISQLVKERPPE